MSTGNTYHKVCTIEDIPKNTGVCALIEGKQIAIFRVGDDGIRSCQELTHLEEGDESDKDLGSRT